MQYTLIYSRRKTLGITVRDGEVIVRAPKGMSLTKIESHLEKHRLWIEKHVTKTGEVAKSAQAQSEDDVLKLKSDAKEYFTKETARISDIMGIKFGRIKITSAKRRFGSCSSSGNICFSYRLMNYPQRAREYVIVHELAHLLEFNHSKKFYEIIERYLPDYKERKKLLK